MLKRMMSGPLGGDQQIGAMVATEKVDYVIFMRDPLNAHLTNLISTHFFAFATFTIFHLLQIAEVVIF